MQRTHRASSGRIGKDRSRTVILFIAYTFVTLFALFCILPLLLILSASVSEESQILKDGYSLLPRGFTFYTYKALFTRVDTLIGSYAVTVLLVLAGGGGGLFITAMTGYALQRPDFRYRNRITLYIYFTTLFGGGLVPFYLLVVKILHLKGSYLAVLLPSMIGAWNIILLKNFMKSIPFSLTESAKVDGAGDFYIFIRIILPLSKAGLATVGLFLAITYWNEWYNAMLFLSPDMKYKPLQLFLYNAINKQNFIRSAAANIAADVSESVPTETMKMAIAVVSTLPIIMVYPFVQRYFIAGITIGAVKG